MRTPAMPTYVLVPGAGLGASAWDPVVPHLQAAGYDVHAVTLPGVGERHDEATPSTGLHAHADSVVADIEEAELHDVVLVAHSYAGMVAAHALSRLADRLRHVVFVAAAVPSAGSSLAAQTGEDGMRMIEGLAAEHGDGWQVPFLPPALIDQFFGEHDLDDDDMDWLEAVATPMPLTSWTEEADVDQSVWASVPRTYVVCTGDPGPSPVSHGQDGWHVTELATGHWPMRTAPRGLAERLLDVVAQR